MSGVLAVVTAVLVVATVLPLWRNPHWLVRGLDFPRLQLSIVAALLLAAELLWLDLSAPATAALVAATAACLLWQAWWILPYTRLWPVEVPSAASVDAAHRLRIITANVLMSNRDAGALIRLVRERQPDLLVTLESDGWWQEQLDVLQDELPHAIKVPLDNYYGMHVYSRLELHDAEIAYLVEDDKPSIHASVTLRNSERVSVHFLHPAPPSPTENPESAERDAELIVVARSVATRDRPVIVTGDLNDVAWSRTTRLFRKLSGLLDPRVGRGMFNTFHAEVPLLRWPLDHVFHSGHFRLHRMELLPAIGSDHFALLTELAFTPGVPVAENQLESDAQARAYGRAIVQDVAVRLADVPRPGA